MSTVNDGGPAFPCGYHPDGNSADQGGMTLRDWFAGQALEGLIASPGIVTPRGKQTEQNENTYAFAAYACADAMIAARNRKGEA